MKQMISKSSVDALQIGTVAVDTKIDGFVARKLPSGKVSYGYRYRDHTRTQRWLSLGVHGQSGTTAETARAKAKVLQGSVAAGKDPGAEKQAAGIRQKKPSWPERTPSTLCWTCSLPATSRTSEAPKTVERCLEVYVRPRIGSKSIYDLKRRGHRGHARRHRGCRQGGDG